MLDEAFAHHDIATLQSGFQASCEPANHQRVDTEHIDQSLHARGGRHFAHTAAGDYAFMFGQGAAPVLEAGAPPRGLYRHQRDETANLRLHGTENANHGSSLCRARSIILVSINEAPVVGLACSRTMAPRSGRNARWQTAKLVLAEVKADRGVLPVHL